MAKKKEYVPQKDDNWNESADKEHRETIKEKEKRIREKYKKGWDSTNHRWKEGFGYY